MNRINKNHLEHRLIVEAIFHGKRSVELALRNGNDFCGETEILNQFVHLDAPTLEGRIVDCRFERRSGERFFTACICLGPEELKSFVGEEVLKKFRGKREINVTILTKVMNQIQEIDAETLGMGMAAIIAFGKASELSPLGKTRLITRVRPTFENAVGILDSRSAIVEMLGSRFSEDYVGEMQIIDEGIHENNPTLGGHCTYWRIEDRGSELLYCSRFTATTDFFKNARDVELRNILTPEGNIFGVTIETELSRDSDGLRTMPK